MFDVVRYSIEEKGHNDNPMYTGIQLYFDDEVDVTATEVTIDGLTLLTRLGGATGVGKEVLWFILMVTDFLIIFSQKTFSIFH